MLPSDIELKKLALRGYTNAQIAQMFGVHRSSVGRRFKAMQVDRYSIMHAVTQTINSAYDVYQTSAAGSHHYREASKALRAYMRYRLGDRELGAAQAHAAWTWHKRLIRKGVILGYDSQRGWFYRPRTPQDGALVLIWPADVPRPSADIWRALHLPTPEESAAWERVESAYNTQNSKSTEQAS